MRKLLNMILFGQSFFKEFPAVALDANSMTDKVLFEINGKQFDVSQTQWLLSLEPMVFGIWSDNDLGIDKESNCQLHFHSKENIRVAVLELKFTDSISEKEGMLFLFEVQHSEVFYCSSFKMRLIYNLYYKRPGQSFSQFNKLAAAFSYPRKVRLISFKKEGYFNIFPMDLAGSVPETDWFVFGLRHSNKTLERIIEEGKIAASEFPASLKEEIYALSKHHSGNPPELDSLPFDLKPTQEFEFPIPEAAIKYHEIEIKKTLNLGSHMLLWGKAINTVTVNEEKPNLYHIHFLNYLNNPEYSLV
ncbi:flavin reductase family protein [Flavobacterium wongokense]|uniref:flavin reductase family protein n=1 Tax=Flavobacterium wongokense TaxID=2910674 RepID=UPI001F1602CD|nr:flavin reductase family protein [Flavobacterium sp. WG47]MCF6131633.1 flavin reductase family protein [Flavobacterium sp. WG47]